MSASIIKHQTQPCPVSCVTTCLAMIAGRPVADLIPEIHQPYRDGDLTLREMLDWLKIRYTAFYSVDNPPVVDDGVYLCTAPSLNIVAGTHQILVEIHDDGYSVHDPVEGREGMKHYVIRQKTDAPPLPENKVELGGFVVDAFIPRSWLEQRASA